mmetsp:Transcript_1162/g.3359  ORF Transcript_1162/g.3359 Transcript_1162/m.3359 type:complete len:203 (-) Transcript_1162:383-991(-)
MFGCVGSCPLCVPKEEADTVRVNMVAMDEDTVHQQEWQRREESEAEQLRFEAQMQREREETEAQMRREFQAFEEAEARRRAEERNSREREAAALAEAERCRLAQRAETERLAREQERRALVAGFLKEHGYLGPATPKRTMMRTKYPIHTAAKVGDADIVAALVGEGANPAQEDSSGQTPAQIAQSRDRKGSHAEVLRALGRA